MLERKRGSKAGTPAVYITIFHTPGDAPSAVEQYELRRAVQREFPGMDIRVQVRLSAFDSDGKPLAPADAATDAPAEEAAT